MAPAMVIIGGQVFISGWNVSKEAEMHSTAIEELSESFGNEMQPVTMEFEGKQYKLTRITSYNVCYTKLLRAAGALHKMVGIPRISTLQDELNAPEHLT